MTAISFQWDGESMTPANQQWARRADEEYVIGERYMLEVKQGRYEPFHRAYFAQIREAWKQLPESHQGAPYTINADALRKHALIKCGFANVATYTAAKTRAEAERWAAALSRDNDYCIVDIQGTTILKFTAKSQAVDAMSDGAFKKSAQAVLDFLSDMIGVDPDTLASNAGRAA